MMKEYTTEFIRNIALVSHSSAGKTMLAEAFLHFTGATTRLGKIEDGSSVSDFEEEEIRRGISLSTGVIPVEFNNHKLNILDTPGYTDFVGEMVSALRVSDGAVVLVDSVAGAEVGTEIAWNYCDQFNIPRFVLINKMDRDNADFQKALASVQRLSEVRLLPVQLPWGEKQDFQGVIDLLWPEFTMLVDGRRLTYPEVAAGSRELKLQSVKSGTGISKPVRDGETPAPRVP